MLTPEINLIGVVLCDYDLETVLVGWLSNMLLLVLAPSGGEAPLL